MGLSLVLEATWRTPVVEAMPKIMSETKWADMAAVEVDGDHVSGEGHGRGQGMIEEAI